MCCPTLLLLSPKTLGFLVTNEFLGCGFFDIFAPAPLEIANYNSFLETIQLKFVILLSFNRCSS